MLGLGNPAMSRLKYRIRNDLGCLGANDVNTSANSARYAGDA